MNIYLYCIYKSFYFQFSKSSTLTNLSIIFSTSICLLCIIITLSVSDGFKANIIKKIIEMDGIGHIYPYNRSFSIDDQLIKLFEDKGSEYLFYPYMQTYSILKYNNISEGINLVSLYKKDKFKKYIVEKFYDKEDGIYIGNKLADKLNISKKTNVLTVFVNENKERYVKNLPIKGIYSTNIPSYDDYIVFSDYSLEDNKEIFNLNTINEYIVFSKNDNVKLLDSDEKYFFASWKDRNYEFVNWLHSYDVPIKILLIFLILVALINNLSMFNLDIINRRKEIELFDSFGLSRKSILFLFLIKVFILTLLGIIIANLVSFIFIKLQYQYNFISIPPGIYFTNFLPVVYRIENYLYPSIVILLFSLSLPLIFMKYFKIVKK